MPQEPSLRGESVRKFRSRKKFEEAFFQEHRRAHISQVIVLVDGKVLLYRLRAKHGEFEGTYWPPGLTGVPYDTPPETALKALRRDAGIDLPRGQLKCIAWQEEHPENTYYFVADYSLKTNGKLRSFLVSDDADSRILVAPDKLPEEITERMVEVIALAVKTLEDLK